MSTRTIYKSYTIHHRFMSYLAQDRRGVTLGDFATLEKAKKAIDKLFETEEV